jgi:L-seryl-tRNA(Ser) seleniumtransferase
MDTQLDTIEPEQLHGAMLEKNDNRQAEFRKLPAVDTILHLPSVTPLVALHGQEQTIEAIRTTLAEARNAIGQGTPAPSAAQLADTVQQALAHTDQPTLRAVINATGVIIHTNLGRAPLSDGALNAIAQAAHGYSNLEYDLDHGTRGSRHDHARGLLATLTGAEDALVVNNNAAAIYFILSAFCQGREVLVSRGQLVEIGGGFRIPDVLRQSGATLVEVGTTNRTHAHDFAVPITPETAAIMRIHTSNFKQIGFVTMPTLAELAAIADEHGVLLIDDLGSGTLLKTADYGLAPEPLVQESIAAGADLVTFSGDKLLGGPQAGIIVGRQELIAQLRRHPMARVLRVDKLTFAALDATLRSYQRGQATAELPVWQMISATPVELRSRVAQWQSALAAHGIASTLVNGESAVGGGSLPGETLPSVLLALDHAQPDTVAAQLRQQTEHDGPPVICRIQQGQLLFDARTVLPTQESDLLQRIVGLFHE